jgi:hypothetical protein
MRRLEHLLAEQGIRCGIRGGLILFGAQHECVCAGREPSAAEGDWLDCHGKRLIRHRYVRGRGAESFTLSCSRKIWSRCSTNICMKRGLAGGFLRLGHTGIRKDELHGRWRSRVLRGETDKRIAHNINGRRVPDCGGGRPAVVR